MDQRYDCAHIFLRRRDEIIFLEFLFTDNLMKKIFLNVWIISCSEE